MKTPKLHVEIELNKNPYVKEKNTYLPEILLKNELLPYFCPFITHNKTRIVYYDFPVGLDIYLLPLFEKDRGTYPEFHITRKEYNAIIRKAPIVLGLFEKDDENIQYIASKYPDVIRSEYILKEY